MHIVKRRARGKWTILGGPLLILVGLLKILDFYRRPVVGESTMLVGAHYGAALDGLLWIGFGVVVLLVTRRSKTIPAVEYDESEARVIRAKAFGSNKIIAIPIPSITKFQSSEPGVTDIYFTKDGDETIENVDADAADLEKFINYVNLRKTNQTETKPAR